MAMNFATDVIVDAANKLTLKKIEVPTTSGGSTAGPGSNGQVLKSNGSTVYWGNSDAPTAITNSEIDALFS